MKRKRAFTLMEIMIVIFLIGIIGGVISYNMRGSMDKGRAFKSEQAIAQIQDILEMEIAEGAPIDQVINHPEKYLAKSGLVKDPKNLIKDGWNEKFVITLSNHDDHLLEIHSEKLEKYKKKQEKALK